MKTINYLNHFLKIIWIPIVAVTIIPMAAICFYITKNSISHPIERKRAFKKVQKLYPKNLFKEWLEGFKDI